MWWVFHANTPETQTLFQSGWFVVGLLSQTLIVHMIRTRRLPFIQSRAAAADGDDIVGDGGGSLVAVFAAGVLPAVAGAAVKLFPVADCHSGGLYDVNPVGERVLQQTLWLAVNTFVGDSPACLIPDIANRARCP